MLTKNDKNFLGTMWITGFLAVACLGGVLAYGIDTVRQGQQKINQNIEAAQCVGFELEGLTEGVK